jgi:trehalose 6-phosphate synthase
MVKFIVPSADAYEGYYDVIANPLLWFLQHNMWDNVHAPMINSSTWRAWEEGYVRVNQFFADGIAREIKNSYKPVLVMLQDYHLPPQTGPRLLLSGEDTHDPFHSFLAWF